MKKAQKNLKRLVKETLRTLDSEEFLRLEAAGETGMQSIQLSCTPLCAGTTGQQ